MALAKGSTRVTSSQPDGLPSPHRGRGVGGEGESTARLWKGSSCSTIATPRQRKTPQAFSPWFVGWLLLASLWLATPLLASEPAKLLVLGDSLSAAYGIPVERGWVALLEQRLAGQAQPWQLVNASISGETSAGGLARLPGLLQRQRPQALILALGANDGLRGLPPSQLAENLSAMAQAAKDSGAAVLLVGVRLPPNYGPAYAEAFAAAYSNVAGQFQLPLVDSLLTPVEADRDNFQADQIHPVAEVQPQILQALWPHIEALLQRAAASTAPD